MKTMGLYMSKIGQVYKCNCGQMVDSVRIGRGHANSVSLASVDLSAVSQKKVTQVCCLERSHLQEGPRTGARYVTRTERTAANNAPGILRPCEAPFLTTNLLTPAHERHQLITRPRAAR